jgi:hypothetical protein
MAGDWHEAIAKLIADNPDLAWELYEIGRDRAIPVCTDAWHLADGGGRGRPVSSELCPDANTRAESLGAPIFKKREADRVVRLEFADKSALMVICEVQSEWKQEKYYRLPGYAARVFDDYRHPVELVLVCKSDGLAAKYRKGIWTGEHSVVTPFSVGPSDLVPITDQEAIGQSAQLSTLTVLMQPLPESREALDKMLPVLTAQFSGINPEKAGDYAYYLSKLKGEEFKMVMEEAVREADPEWWRQASRRMAEKFSDEFIEEGRKEGREEALRRDRAALYALLDGLGVETGSQARARIDACTEPDELTTWITKVIRIRTVDELFGDPSD